MALADIAPALSPVAKPTTRLGESQWILMWRRFSKHKAAMAGGIVVLAFYLLVLFADFFAYADPERSSAQRSLLPPQAIHFIHDGQFRPHVLGLSRVRNPATFELEYTPDPDRVIPVSFFAAGRSYKLFGLIPANVHFFGVADGGDAGAALAVLGTDVQGRDLWSRIIYGTQVSLTIGLAGVALGLVLGVGFGGISGFMGGRVDEVIQRGIEVLRSIPTIPLWMGLTAALPPTWSTLQVYFAVTIIISLVSWTELARVARGRFLALREEDFITAARLDGCSTTRIIVHHMIPSFLSHLIAATTLAIPVMIVSETALSFLGLGLRPPAISWGVLLQQAQNVRAIALTPWLLLPAVPVVVAVLAFNFLGDGLRDAADPYGR